MYNTFKARDRIKLAIDDLKRSISRYREGDYPDSIFRMQLSVEGACKAILSFLGVEYEKTHFPSVVIGKILSRRRMIKQYSLNKGHIERLIHVAMHAAVLESHGSMPRYGWETEERLITPIEIYSGEVALHLLREGLEALNHVAGFFKLFKLPSHLEGEVERLIEEKSEASGKLG